MLLESKLLCNKIDVTPSLIHNVTFRFEIHIFVVCGSIWTFFAALKPRKWPKLVQEGSKF